MRVAVSGSSGLIGSALVRALTARGDEVVRLVRPDSPTARGAVVRWDPRASSVSADDLDRVGTLDAVVHLAGAGIADRRWTPTRRREILTSRVASTSLIASMVASRPGVTRVVSGSAIGYYGSRGDEVLDETSSRGTGYLADVCDAWEQAIQPARHAGATVATVRTGIVMSAAGGALGRQLPLFRLGLGGRLGDGRQWLSPISLDDEVRALLWVMDQGLDGPFNLVAPAPVTNRDFTATLGRLLRRPTLAPVPRAALALVLGRDLADEAVLASQRVVPRALEASGYHFRHPDLDAILGAALADR
ncbi:MAG: TIGR01777 family oxidoreductase [Acidimicrobiales bacterium]